MEVRPAALTKGILDDAGQDERGTLVLSGGGGGLT